MAPPYFAAFPFRTSAHRFLTPATMFARPCADSRRLRRRVAFRTARRTRRWATTMPPPRVPSPSMSSAVSMTRRNSAASAARRSDYGVVESVRSLYQSS
jgi:hypothetical protein